MPCNFSQLPKTHRKGILNSHDDDMNCYLCNKGKDNPLKADLEYIHIITMQQGRSC